jgi:Mg/Co/Ni transporter MgtE
MNIQAEKLEIVKMILETDNPSILESIKKLFKTTKADFWDTLPQDQKEDILKGIGEIEKGDVVDYEDFMKKHR